jgi:hypothetical protein
MPEAAVSFTDNHVFSIAEEFVNHTSRCIFLTGKAGTGKTTFLRHIKNNTLKKTVVVAPTGVAAIHAGGTTVHSFFQLPFTPFIPEPAKASVEWTDQYALLKNLKIESEKRTLFREMELLIIDEVSMVRSDVLDSIDTILRYIRKKRYQPFGGVQVLFIGDLFQLPPVVPDDQWRILSQYYESPFFFHARVMRDCTPLYIELKKIYRQTDRQFIDLLNHIRTNEVSKEDLELLNKNYAPDFKPSNEENYVTLTTHNHKADKINVSALAELPGKEYKFEASIEGEFPERAFPTDVVLTLKEGSQVMFIKNDMERVRRYYNGKIGTVLKVTEEEITVVFPGELTELIVEKETWKNVTYSYNPAAGQIEEEIIGTFTQYAIRLAWAITIHKSQGLTFSKVVIDAGQSFAPGQVYVALSRCTSLEGIVLHSLIFKNSIRSDERVIRYAEEEASIEELEPILKKNRVHYLIETLINVFDWDKVLEELRSFLQDLQERKFTGREDAQKIVEEWIAKSIEHQEVARKFQHQIKAISDQEDFQLLEQRLKSAIVYFTNRVGEEIIDKIVAHKSEIKQKSKVKKYTSDLTSLCNFFETFRTCLTRSQIILKDLQPNGTVPETTNPA